MDPRLLHYYNRELEFMREMGSEFAREFPKIAGRLGLEGFECADPYVERLLEGFAFMAARVQLKLDAEFPRFTQHLLELVYPHYLAPTPSMAVVRLEPDLTLGELRQGFVVPRGSALRSVLGKDEQTPCEYRTAQDVTLWPLELVAAQYLPTSGAVAALGISVPKRVRAGIRLLLKTTAGLSFNQLALENLPMFLRGAEERPVQIYEQLVGHTVGVVLRPMQHPAPWYESIDSTSMRRMGFGDHEALLPFGPRSFSGYRLLKEYFAFPERYLFVELTGLGKAVRRCEGSELEIFVLLAHANSALEHTLDTANFALFCTPAINLFPRNADRIHLSERTHEYHVVPDRARPMDFEAYAIESVTGYGTSTQAEQVFLPFYGHAALIEDERQAYYTIYREPRRPSSGQKRRGARSSYVGSEVFVALVDAAEAPYSSGLRQLAVQTLCTNRDLPLHMPVGCGKTDFTLELGAPVGAVRIVAGPTPPRPAVAQGVVAWRLISHLTPNYLSLLDHDAKQGAVALRSLLRLYGDETEAHVRRRIDGIHSVSSRPIVRRLPSPGPITVGRGLEITVIYDELAFEGSGVFLLGAVLDEFFARYVSINTLTETVIRSRERGEVMRWPSKIGRRHVL